MLDESRVIVATWSKHLCCGVHCKGIGFKCFLVVATSSFTIVLTQVPCILDGGKWYLAVQCKLVDRSLKVCRHLGAACKYDH